MSEPFVTIRLGGPPRGKGRPRFGRRGSFVAVWTDKKTAAYEDMLAAEGRAVMNGTAMRLGALSVQIHAGMPVPASWSQKKRQAALSGDLSPTGKPDFDNLAKCVGDALNKIVWKDDSQIVVCAFRKFYSSEPGLTISVWDWD